MLARTCRSAQLQREGNGRFVPIRIRLELKLEFLRALCRVAFVDVTWDVLAERLLDELAEPFPSIDEERIEIVGT